MIHPGQRRALGRFLVPLSVALAFGVAGCADTGQQARSSGALKSLSDLPNQGQSMLKLAAAARDGGDCPAALRFYRPVIDKAEVPGEVLSAYLGTASCEVALGQLAEAERDYKAVGKLAPDNPSMLVGLGRIALMQHNPGDAASLLDLAITEGATEVSVWNDKGIALDQLRRHGEAQKTYREGLVRFASDRALRNNLALSLAMTRGFDEAESLLRALAQDPEASPRTRQNLALVLGLKGDDAGAREVSETDLNGAALDNNGHFYDYARAVLSGAPPPSPSAKSSNHAEKPDRAAHVADAAMTEPHRATTLSMKTDGPVSIESAAIAAPAAPSPRDDVPVATAGALGSPTPLVAITPVAATRAIVAEPRPGPVASSDAQN